MAHIQLSDLSLAFGARDIFKNINFTLHKGKKTALSGANGSGKTTLLKLMAGLMPPDGGSIQIPKGTRVAYLPQTGVKLGDGTALEEGEKAFSFLDPLMEEMEDLGRRLQTHPEDQNALVRHHEIQETLQESGYYDKRRSTEMALLGLGFSPRDLDKRALDFSGGWQMRIALAQVLLQDPDILLLDEPTNYLDFESIQWLLSFLKRFSGGVLLVSHDRGFLDALVGETAEIFGGKLTLYKGNYSQYEARRKQEIESLKTAWLLQQEEIQRLEEFIGRFRYQASKATQVQSRVKELERMEKIQIPESLIPLKFAFPKAPHSGNIMVTLDGLGKTYGSQEVLKDLNLVLERGEKLIIAGPNGAGKSTLMRILSGSEGPTTGQVKWGTDVKIGYFSQDYEKNLNPGKTVMEEVESEAPTHLLPQIRSLLGAFLFHRDDVFKQVSVLSGGEKNRLSLLKLLLHPANLLILDEPTNHLDLASKDVLLSALQAYDGTLIFVSHDSYFLENLGTKVLQLAPGARHILHLGDFRYFREKTAELDNLTPQGQSQAQSGTETSSQSSRRDNKQKQALLRRLQREEEVLVEKIAERERQRAEIQAQLSLPEVYTQGQKVKKLNEELKEAEQSLDILQTQWMEKAEELEEARKEG